MFGYLFYRFLLSGQALVASDTGVDIVLIKKLAAFHMKMFFLYMLTCFHFHVKSTEASKVNTSLASTLRPGHKENKCNMCQSDIQMRISESTVPLFKYNSSLWRC